MSRMTLIYKTARREYWLAPFDPTAEVFEMFASEEANDYLGCFDTKAQALAYAKQHAAEEEAR